MFLFCVIYRAILNVVDEDEHGQLVFNFSLVLIDVCHDFLEWANCFAQQLMIPVRFGRFLEDVYLKTLLNLFSINRNKHKSAYHPTEAMCLAIVAQAEWAARSNADDSIQACSGLF